LGVFFCGILDPAAAQDCTKFPSSITNALLQLVRDIIKYVASVMKNVLSNKNINICAPEENLEEQL